MEEFSANPICYIHNSISHKYATGWMCSPNGYVMGPAHLFINDNQLINKLSSIYDADIFEIYYKQKKYQAYLVFAYKNVDEFMDVALLRLIDESNSEYEFYSITLDCAQKNSIHMAGYGDINKSILNIAEGHYVSKTHHKEREGKYYLKVTCPDAVQKGFSGSPVYVDESGAVVGMQIRAASLALNYRNQRAAEKKSIYAVPMKLIVERFPFMRKILVLKGTGYSGCEIPPKLIRAISEGNCILFVGAGCSIDAGLPAWKDLVTNLMYYTYDILQTEDDEKQELEDLLKKGKLMIIAQHCRDRLGKHEFGKFLNEQLNNGKDIYENAVAQQILSSISFKAILTTNFDYLIEHFNEEAVAYTVDKYNEAFSGENKPIMKIHGSIEKPESIVLTSADFRKTIFGNEEFRKRLKELFKNSTVLFVGYSFEDPNISMLLQELLTNESDELRTHYAIMPNTKRIVKKYYYDEMNVSVISFTTKWNTFEPFHNVLNDLVACLPPQSLKPSLG